MTERRVNQINFERYLDRLDRIAPASEPLGDQPSPPAALALLAQLTGSIGLLKNDAAAGIQPLLAQVREHVEALFPSAADSPLDEKAHTAHKECLEELFQTLEGVLYACSLS